MYEEHGAPWFENFQLMPLSPSEPTNNGDAVLDDITPSSRYASESLTSRAVQTVSRLLEGREVYCGGGVCAPSVSRLAAPLWAGLLRSSLTDRRSDDSLGI